MAGAAVTPLAPLAALCALRRAVRLSCMESSAGRGLWLHKLTARAPGGLRAAPASLSAAGRPQGASALERL